MANGEKFWKYSRVISWLIGILFVAGITYGQIWRNSKDIQKVEIKAETNEKTIIGIEKDIQYIKAGIDDIKKKL